MREDFLWTEKYRPRRLDEVILPDSIKNTFRKFLDQGNLPNMILSGPAGTGKTTLARALLDELGCDSIIINGSLNGNIDTLRNEIMNFASSVSMTGGRKYVILDEADYLNPQSTQPALRNFMEEYSKNCGFILTCNFKNRIIKPLHSRCTVVDFIIDKNDRPKLAMEFFHRACKILEENDVSYDKATVSKLVMKYFPDNRRILNELQRFSAGGSIDASILTSMDDLNIKGLFKILKSKNFKDMRVWVAENLDNDVDAIIRKIFSAGEEYLTPRSLPAVILILAEYQYKSAFVVDQELNMTACLTEIMAGAEFK